MNHGTSQRLQTLKRGRLSQHLRNSISAQRQALEYGTNRSVALPRASRDLKQMLPDRDPS